MNLLQRLFHWGPLFALGIIKGITWAFVFCVQMWWPPQTSWGAFVNYYVFLLLSVLTIANLLLAMHYGPGYLPPQWKPVNAEDCTYLQYCTACNGYKAPRSHHCRKCKCCVMKMDHHCPWINNCVGHRNHTNFVLFLFFAVCGCAQACYNVGATLYAALNANYYYYHGPREVPLVIIELKPFVFCLFALGLSVGVVCAVGFLLFGQVLPYAKLKSILRNVPGIEDWILEKAAYRREGTGEVFTSPYDLGRWRNFTQVFNWTLRPRGDGIVWPVRPGCSQYTFTIEQLEQKKVKRERAVQYVVEREYNGRWFPLKHGWRVCIRPPCTDEPRLVLKSTDKLLVTRWKRYWLYGEIIERDGCELNAAERRQFRGWFPRHCCAVAAAAAPVEEKKTQ